MAVSFRPEDRAFVQIAVDECRRLNLTKHIPTALIWNPRLPADQPFLDRSYLMMPEALNGKILPQEARPLIMSAIIQKEVVKRYNPPNRYFGLFMLFGVVGLVGSIAALILVSNAMGLATPSDSFGGSIVLAWFALLFVAGGLLRLKNNRMQRLDSDLQVARLIGSDLLSQTLAKIENFNLTSRRGRLRMLVSGYPSLSQRIANLKNPSLPITEKDALEAFQKRWGPKP